MPADPVSGTEQECLPKVGDLVRVRTRRWLVEEVTDPGREGHSPVVRLACVDDDNQGQALDVYWNYELDRHILRDDGWRALATKRFDEPRMFAAFLHTLRWGCVTATNPNLFQAPFRAGIKIDAYQMEPLRKALLLPRVNLFIADDTGLGKTIEAGLIARELLLRKKAKQIVVSAPPSVLEQWRAELEERFGLLFEILDRRYMSRMRRERGFGVNPWRTHSRFLISHNLLIDPIYADPMREWLGTLLPGSLLILDEAHHAAPSAGGRYGIESKFTRAVRDIAHRFEHRLFLSATPHNGHSNSFSTLLELLDPYRFTRGVRVRGRRALGDVMVRRLKEDIRSLQGGFPKRRVVPIVIDGLPQDAPELVLSRLLDDYRTVREARYVSASGTVRAAAALLVVGLQQRLLSSIEAFAQTLDVHRKTVERQWERFVNDQAANVEARGEHDSSLLTDTPDADDERSAWTDAEYEKAEETQVEASTAKAEVAVQAAGSTRFPQKERELLNEMRKVGEQARGQLDAKTNRLIDWIRSNMCPGLPPFGSHRKDGASTPQWNSRRVLVFTENRASTKRYLRDMLELAIATSDRADERIEVIDGLTGGTRRREIQRRFNADPSKEPLRILLATDAAREGLNFQAHCTDLFHYDLPWNPGRIEQRNGRIDRKLQPADEVRCHYFELPQRVEDRVLKVLVRKTETIKKELGSLSKVIDDDVERSLKQGIRHKDADRLAQELQKADLDSERKRVTEEELECARERREELDQQHARCQTLLERSREWVGFQPEPFREALSSSLHLLGADSLKAEKDGQGRQVWSFPPLHRKGEGDPSWVATLDTLRTPRKVDQKLAHWRTDAPIRPVVFEDVGVLTDDVVHLHLEQRVAQRLLARFRAQGFIHHDLSRACLAQSRDSIPRVVLLGRLSLYGHGAERLHEEIVPLAARWVRPHLRKGCLRAFAKEAETRTLELLDTAIAANGGHRLSDRVQEELLRTSSQDVEELKPQLEPRALQFAEAAKDLLRKRGRNEADNLKDTLERQRKRVQAELVKHEARLEQMTLGFNAQEKRELESNMKAWRIRLGQFKQDIEREPDRIRRFYEVRATRIEPVGLVYLWPDTN